MFVFVLRFYKRYQELIMIDTKVLLKVVRFGVDFCYIL